MGKQRNNNKRRFHGHQRKGGKRRHVEDGGRPNVWREVVKENAMFEKYYKALGIIPESEWDAFMAAMRDDLPTTFRITGSRSTAKDLRNCLEKYYIPLLENVVVDGEEVKKPEPIHWYPERLAWKVCTNKRAVKKLPHYARLQKFLVAESSRGNLSRQEEVSMIPPLVLDVQPHHKVLDMCAAPGSKTAQLLESLHTSPDGASEVIPTGFVIANDADNKRCYLLIHQTKRLQSPHLAVTNNDASFYPSLRVRETPTSPAVPLLYDRILCDVPCSGDGTMRKNPAIWNTWNPLNAAGLHNLQARILRRGLQLLAVGGVLVYSTCSLHPLENEAVLCELLQQYQGCIELIDVSDKVGSLKYTPGITSWTVMDKAGVIFERLADVPADHPMLKVVGESHFPPENAAQLGLEKCIRVFPHQQNSGGFFIAAIRKSRALGATDHLAERILRRARERAQAGAGPSTDATAAGAELSSATAADDAEIEAEIAREVASGAATAEDAASGKAPVEKKAHNAFKENPFVLLNDETPSLRDIQAFFGLSEDFPKSQMLCRSEEGQRNIYMVAPGIRDILRYNPQTTARIVNTGVKVLSKSHAEIAACPYRVMQEGLHALVPYLQGSRRFVPATYDDIIRLFTNETSHLPDFSEPVRSVAESIATEMGSIILHFDPRQHPDPRCEMEHPVTISVWRGRNTLRALVTAEDRDSLLVLLRGPQEEAAGPAQGTDTPAGNDTPAETGDEDGGLVPNVEEDSGSEIEGEPSDGEGPAGGAGGDGDGDVEMTES